jgi:hypothetical protein
MSSRQVFDRAFDQITCEQLLSAVATHNPHRHSSYLNTTGHIHPHSFQIYLRG